METQNENNKQNQPTSSKYFSGRNFIINALIAFIPATIVVAILRELGLRGALVMIGVFWGFVYLVGLIREKITNKNKKNKMPTQETVEKNSKAEQPKIGDQKNNKNTKKKWLIGIILIILTIVVIFVLNLNNYVNQAEILLEKTDKSGEYSELVGNLYRNTKYNFRIKFPEGWKIGVGDGAHIVQKATSGDSTISVFVQSFDVEGFEGFSSIKDAGTAKEVIDTVIEGSGEKFSDVKIINYGETKIDNEPAYWVEYSAKSQVLDYQLKITTLAYFIAKGNIMYSINAGTATNEYSEVKPIFMQVASTFVFEN